MGNCCGSVTTGFPLWSMGLGTICSPGNRFLGVRDCPIGSKCSSGVCHSRLSSGSGGSIGVCISTYTACL